MAKRPVPSERSSDGLSRRAALGLGAGALAACGPSGAPERFASAAPSTPFLHGVASGDPLADRVVLWTRVTPGEGEGSQDVQWELAEDESFERVVRRGSARARPGADYTVKVDVDGLEPDRRYVYRFRVGDAASPIGRTRTLPQAGVEPFRLAVVSCSNHPAGWFHAYRHIADRGDVDLILHLGDYIYEYGPGGYATDWGAKHDRIPDPPREIVSLDDYRRRFAQYRSDYDLQAAHAAAPWVTIWDDHESTNNSTRDDAQNHQAETEGDWSARKAASIRAYFEWMPIREPQPGAARSAIWRRFEIGDLATLVMLETRLTARSREVQWSELPVAADADPADPAVKAAVETFLTDIVGAPDRDLLGAEQETFVGRTLAASTAAGKVWQLLGNQVLMGAISAPDYIAELPGWLTWAIKRTNAQAWEYAQRTRFGVPMNLDTWDGYSAARERLYAASEAAGARLLVLTGDSHNFWVNRLKDAKGEARGVEFGTSSVTSPGDFESVTAPGVDFGALTEAANPETLLHDAKARGYLHITLRAEEAVVDLVRIDNVAKPVFSADVMRRYRVLPEPDGRARIEAA